MMYLNDIAGGFFLVTGCLLMLVAGVGVVKLPDVYCRAHALGKAMTLGIIFLLLAMGFLIEEIPWSKIVAVIGFQLVTIPVASHLLCLAAYRRKVRRWSREEWV
jgi:multicomponent Na+:H+ antiporter subunit G